MTAKLTQQDIVKVVRAYKKAVKEGGSPIGTSAERGQKSAVTIAAQTLGRGRVGTYQTLQRGIEEGLLELPKSLVTQHPELALKHGIPRPAVLDGPQFEFLTDKNHSFTFGALGDSHLGSKYERLDCLEWLFDAFEAEGVRNVFHTGNWIEGEAKFNVHDLHTRGLNAQCKYLADHWPKRKGIVTYAVTGNDHEGWYAQREGIDIGRYAEQKFRDKGREDWVDLGYMEAPVLVRDHSSGRKATLSVVHPGGGSAYALSYSIQKIIEALDQGEKPDIGLYGHYHKLWAGNIGNVWCVQTGTTQDQTIFMRGKRLAAHVGGTICRATLDPNTGRVVRFRVELIRYYARGYYRGRWSPSGSVNLPKRAA